MVLGMRYVHSQGIIHRDLKPGNVLLDDVWGAKISDFGMNREILAQGPPSPDTGTVRYRAPEQEDGSGCLARHTTKIDVYAFGIMLSDLLGIPVASVLGDGGESHGEAGKLIYKCLSTDPDQRPSFDDILKQGRESGFAMFPQTDPLEIKRLVWRVLVSEVSRNRTKNPLC
jgi:serine/threonine protein kinase